MKRYAETFFRYWLVALVPIVVLSLVGYAVMKSTPKTAQASAKLWVEPSAADTITNYNQFETPAQSEQDALSQLLQLSSFEWSVAQGSPLYMQIVKKQPDPRLFVGTDLQKNVQFTPSGNNLLYVSYTFTDRNWQVGAQVVQSVLNVALNQTQLLSQQQGKANISYYQAQLTVAEQRAKQSARAFDRYRTAHGVTSTDLNAQMAVDPTLASLYSQSQADQSSVADVRQKLAALQLQSTASSATGQSGVTIADAPSVIIVSSKKKEIMGLAIYLVIGLLLGGGFIVVKTLRDRSLRYADEVPEALDLPVLAVVPYNPALAGRDSKAMTSMDKSGPGKNPLTLRQTGS